MTYTPPRTLTYTPPRALTSALPWNTDIHASGKHALAQCLHGVSVESTFQKDNFELYTRYINLCFLFTELSTFCPLLCRLSRVHFRMVSCERGLRMSKRGLPISSVESTERRILPFQSCLHICKYANTNRQAFKLSTLPSCSLR